jgi:ABC-type sugar transport system ATPase subunit
MGKACGYLGRGLMRRDILKRARIMKSFSGLRALNGVKFEVCEGEIVGLFGTDGSGKTLSSILSHGLSGTVRGGTWLGPIIRAVILTLVNESLAIFVRAEFANHVRMSVYSNHNLHAEWHY